MDEGSQMPRAGHTHEMRARAEDAGKFILTREAYERMGVEADAVLRLGMLHMGAGASGYRVMRSMKRTARALGFDSLDIVVGVTQITCTFHRGKSFRTIVARQHSPAVDASCIEALEDCVHNRLFQGMTAEDVNTMLDDIEAQGSKRWNMWILSAASAVGCASFAFLNHFPLIAVALVALSAFFGQLMRSVFQNKHVNQLGSVIVAALVSSLVYAVLSHLLAFSEAADPEQYTTGYVAAVLFLVPGFPLYSSLIDLARCDFEAGLARLAYAGTLIMTAAFTVAMVSKFVDLRPHVIDFDPYYSWYVIAFCASVLGVAGFAFLFNSSGKMILVASLVGAVGNMLRLGVLAWGGGDYMGAFIGGLSIGVIGGWVASRVNLPRITTTIPAAVIMVPGVSLFHAVYYLSVDDMAQALSYAATSMMVIFSIGVGMIVARMMTDKDWVLGRLIDFDHRPTLSREETEKSRHRS